MSEPVQKPDSEDTLSSILRLISDENRQGTAARGRKHPSAGERFVLTPELRVADAPQIDAPAPGGSASGDATAAEPQAASPAGEIRRPAPAPENPELAMRAPERAEVTVDAGTPEETAPPAAPVTDGMTVPLVEPARPEGAISPLRLYQDPEQTLAEATGSLKAELERVTQSAEPVRARRRVTLAKPGNASTDTPGGGAVGSADPDAASLLPSSELKAKIASLAGAVERSRGYWQEPATPSEDIGTVETETPPVPGSDPDLHGAMSVSGTQPGVTEDRGLNGNVDVPKPEQPMNNAFDGYDGVDLEEAFIDEETLRQMVAEIVREELRGALGSRITRNMRKLVRQEIQRMLEAPTRDTSEETGTLRARKS